MVVFVSSKILSLIVARAGSKGLQNKNILQLNDKRVFLYTLEYSLELEKKYNLNTLVSTDSKKIIKYCINNNIDYIIRDESLSTSKTRIEDVVYDIKWLDSYDYVSLLYADIPTRYINIFDKSIKFLEQNEEYDAAMSMKKVEFYYPETMFKYNENKLSYNKNIKYRKQDFKNRIIHDGHTLIFKTDYFINFMEDNDVSHLYQQFGEVIKPIIHNEIVIPLNNENDFKLAEKYLR